MDLSKAARWGMHWTPKMAEDIKVRQQLPPQPPSSTASPRSRLSPTAARGSGGDGGGGGARAGNGGVGRRRRLLPSFARGTGAALHGHVRHYGGDGDVGGGTSDRGKGDALSCPPLLTLHVRLHLLALGEGGGGGTLHFGFDDEGTFAAAQVHLVLGGGRRRPRQRPPEK